MPQIGSALEKPCATGSTRLTYRLWSLIGTFTRGHLIGGPEIRSRAVHALAVTMPTNPGQVAADRRHFATICVTVPTEPTKTHPH